MDNVYNIMTNLYILGTLLIIAFALAVLIAKKR